MKSHGTTLDCFMDLMKRIEPELYEKRRLLAQVLGVEDSTVRRWVIGTAVPHGMSMISLRYYLDYLGYQVSELSDVSGVVKDAGRIVAFRVMSLEDLSKLTGHENHPDQLLRILRGVRGLSNDREVQLRDIVDAYKSELQTRLAETPRLVTVKTVSPEIGRSSTSVPLTTSKSVPRPGTKGIQSRDERFGGLVANLLDFARYYTWPEVSEEERDQMRDVVGQQKIFDLKNVLSRLCGSKAFGNNS